MNGLRVYFDTVSRDRRGRQRVFYSRRADGPLYCWRYEEELGRWSVSRVCLPKFTLGVLCVARWKAIPITLQAMLSEHYLE